MTTPPAHDTRLERILGVPLAGDAMRQWIACPFRRSATVTLR